MEPLQVGLMFWTGGVLGVDATPGEIAKSVASLGVTCGQLGVHGAAELTPAAAEKWRAALEHHQLEVVTAFLSFEGESYASIPICSQTVGYVPPGTRRERELRTYAVSDFAHSLGIPGVAAHIGCLPEDPSDPEHRAVLELLRRVCDHCAHNGQTFALETGQEPAAALLEFLRAVDRPNLGVNFDPANMILYGSGDPMEALRTLGEHVLTVHCKDGTWPATAGAWGQETPLGDGDVGMQRYVRTLREVGYAGPLVIEREIVGEEQRADIRQAIDLLNSIRA